LFNQRTVECSIIECPTIIEKESSKVETIGEGKTRFEPSKSSERFTTSDRVEEYEEFHDDLDGLEVQDDDYIASSDDDYVLLSDDDYVPPSDDV
jgi:hypothetical protein